MPGLSMSLISWYISNLHENLLILCDEDHLSVGQFWQSFNQEFVIVINMIVCAGEEDFGAPVQKGGETAVWGGKLAAGNQDVHTF